MQLNDMDGYYIPSFFYMVLDTCENVDKVLEKNTQTFIHEFIHYLQDLILPYNIRLNLANLSCFADVKQYAEQNDVLIRPFTNWNENSKLLKRQMEYTLGKGKFLEQKLCIESIEKDYFTIPSTHANVYKYTLKLKNPRRKYHIGAIDMLEYIAHKIETKHYEDNIYQTPYKTIDSVFDFYQLTDIPFNVRLCIVEFCLYNDNPINMLFNNFLDNGYVKNNKNIFLNYSNCYTWLSHKQSWKSVGGFNETIISKTLRRLEDFKTELTNHFSAPQFNAITQWIETVVSYIRKELIDRFLFSDMYQMNSQELSDCISFILKEIGFPMILNKESKCVSLLNSNVDILQFTQFFILQKFLIYIEKKERMCPIYDFCNANGQISTSHCKISPTLYLNNSNACPYALFLKSYNLTNIR